MALATPRALIAAELSRDLGSPHALLVGDSRSVTFLVFWPRYSAGSQPATTTERRALFSGWLVGRVSPEAAIAAPLRAARDIGLAPHLLLTPAAGVDPLTNTRDGTATRANPVAAGMAWHVDFASSDVGPSAALWLSAGLGALGALAVVGLGWVSARRQRDISRGYADVKAQVQMLGDLGGSLQESLDLGTVLPGVLSRLSGEFALDHSRWRCRTPADTSRSCSRWTTRALESCRTGSHRALSP